MIQEHLESWHTRSPDRVDETSKSLYVDDLISGDLSTKPAEQTKRGILPKLAKTYNPLGLASPLNWKLMYRET